MEANISRLSYPDDSLDRGLLYAEACFETLRVVHGTVFRWSEHEARLARGLAQFGLSCPADLLSRCLQAAGKTGDDALVRLTVSGGNSQRGLLPENTRQPQVHVQAWPYRQPIQAMHLRTLPWPLGGMARNAKFTADYAATIRLLHQARHNGLLGEDEQALFTRDGEVLAMETANILLHVDGRWLSPTSDAVLPGVIRAALRDAGCIELAFCPLDWLAICDALAICNSGCFVRAVASVNGRRLATAGHCFDALLAAFRGESGVPERICV
ncbi:MAG: aminotransferase class IV [Mariprofundaceae bacterium]|nr:aminotransferase class IV [Mariprofundaceae bacterium]